MPISPTLIFTAKRWAASWWSLAIQAVSWAFYAISFVALVFHHDHYQRGVIPEPAFQFRESDGLMFMVMDPELAMRQWYFLIAYCGFCVLAGPLLFGACWRLRHRLQKKPEAGKAP